MTLTEYENIIKEKVDHDPKDPQIYVLLQQFIEQYLVRKKACKTRYDYIEVANTLAEDVYLNILNGTVLNRYMLYFDKCYKRYVKKYYEENKKTFVVPDVPHETINVEDDKEFKIRLCIENLDSLVDELLAESCKYSKYTTVYNNLKLSLILSLLRHEETYFHLNKSQQSYVKTLYSKFINVLDELSGED